MSIAGDETSSVNIEIRLTLEDLVALRRHMIAKGRVPGLWLTLGASVVGLFLLVWVRDDGTGSLAARLPLIALVVGLFVFFLWRAMGTVTRRELDRLQQSGDMERLTMPIRMTLRPLGIDFLTATSQTRLDWPAIARIDTTADHVFVFVSSATAHIVPARAFPDRAAFEAFAHGIAMRHAAATSSTRPASRSGC